MIFPSIQTKFFRSLLNRGILRTSRNIVTMEFSEVVKRLNSFAPLELAESWDNVGVLVQPPDMRPVSKMLLTNDLTLAVMDEAENKNVELILSYHPPIFKALKSVTANHWKERIIGRCLAKGIAVYSPHTCYDAVKGGINDWLISAFGKGDVSAIIPSYSSGHWTHKIEISSQGPNTRSDLRNILLANFKDGILLFSGREEDNSVTFLCFEEHLTNVLSVIANLPFKTQFAISKMEKVPLVDHGVGRRTKLHQPITLKDAVDAAKKHLNLPHLRLAIKHEGSIDDVIRTVAVCAGSGISVLRGAKADLVLTGEMSHHDTLEMTQRGRHVILTEHSNSERGYISSVLRNKLSCLLNARVEVLVSEKDRDPLETV